MILHKLISIGIMPACRFAVGTDRGLVVLDTCKNILVQVIGSDNKLLSKCCGPL